MAVFMCLKRSGGFVIPAAAGFLVSVAVCAFRTFFLYSHRLTPYSFIENFIFYSGQSVLPPIILYGIYMLLARDSKETKNLAFFPLTASFYSVFLPYIVISGAAAGSYTVFDAVIKPLLYLAELLLCAELIPLVRKEAALGRKITAAAAVALSVISTALPAAAESLYMTRMAPSLCTALCAVCICAPAAAAAVSIMAYKKTEF